MTPLQAGTQLLVHFDETSGTFVDTSAVRRVLTLKAGSTGVSASTDAKFGVRAVAFSNTSFGRYDLQCPFNGAVPFFIEAWVKPTAFATPVSWVFGAASTVAIGMNSTAGGSQWYGTVWPASGGGLTLVSPSAATLNAYAHVLFGQDETLTRRLFINGVQAASGAAVIGPIQATIRDFGIGGSPGDTNTTPLALVDELRYALGVPCPTAGFTPPAAPYDDISPSLLNYKQVPPAVRLQTTPRPAINYKAAPQASYLFDNRDGGRGRIVGTVKEQATPSNLPLRRRVRLFRENEGRFVREQWSDAVTGNYAFDNIDHTVRYTVVSYDYLNNHRAVIADNLLPEVTP